LPGVVKYLHLMRRAERKAGSAARLREMAAATFNTALAQLQLATVTNGSLHGGTAFDVEVSIDYWLVSPA
jgi:hypothetical protein